MDMNVASPVGLGGKGALFQGVSPNPQTFTSEQSGDPEALIHPGAVTLPPTVHGDVGGMVCALADNVPSPR
ncbi:hypothetical protein, partial [Nitratireductor soli]|uniref:hypothetical protein n=1 Tax=Nitratireductor soli TaxID=1670619 RepID=UPI000B12B360